MVIEGIGKSLAAATRRLLIAIAVAATGSAGFGARAAAPQQMTQGPGYYRLALGDFEITALSDGTFDMDTAAMLTNTTPQRRRQLLGEAFEVETVQTSVNAYLINTGERLILIDTGAAGLFGPTLGHLLANLVASGYRPEQVDEVLLTHLHPDHVGGLIREGAAVFSNARVRVEEREAGFWLSPTERASAPPDRQGFFDGVAASLAPYRQTGRFATFAASADLSPGIRAVPAPGHTPGHTMFAIESRGEKLVLWGDLMEVAAIQFVDSEVTILFDSDPRAAAAQRPAIYADAATGRYLVGVAHLPFPGLGRLRVDTGRYVWVPLPYADIR